MGAGAAYKEMFVASGFLRRDRFLENAYQTETSEMTQSVNNQGDTLEGGTVEA